MDDEYLVWSSIHPADIGCYCHIVSCVIANEGFEMQLQGEGRNGREYLFNGHVDYQMVTL